MRQRLVLLGDALLAPINTAIILILGVYTIVWGLWVVNPFWEVFTRAPIYHHLDYLGEYFWGSLAIVCGIITSYGAYKPRYRYLTIGAAVACWHWSMISFLYFWGDWRNTGGISSAAFAVLAAYIWLNIAVNHKGER